MRIVPLSLADANTVVAAWHRHHQPTTSHRFSIGAVHEGEIVGVAIIGRPVSRIGEQGIAEVLRVATNGTDNACSTLLGAAARAAKQLGYHRIQTYTLPEEGGASLRASGWKDDGVTPSSNSGWHGRSGHVYDHTGKRKSRWVRELNPPVPEYELPAVATAIDQPRIDLF